MYLPKSKYSIIIVKPGQYTLDGIQYVGQALLDYKGTLYAGTTPETVRGVLVPMKEEPVKKVEVAPLKPKPTEEDYKRGSYLRYFRQDNITGKVDEVPETGSLENSRYTYESASWILTGSIQDVEYKIDGRTKPAIIRGVGYKNNQTITLLEKSFPSIRVSGVLNNPEEFCVEST